MATRTQIVRRAWSRIQHGDLDTTPWYKKEGSWKTMAKVAGISADVFRAFDKPGVATTIDTVNGILSRHTMTRTDAATWLRGKLQAISTDIQKVNKQEDPIIYAELDAKLELIMELLGEDKVTDG